MLRNFGISLERPYYDLFTHDKDPFIEAEHQALMRQREEYTTRSLVWFISAIIRIFSLISVSGLYMLPGWTVHPRRQASVGEAYIFSF